MIYSKIKFGTEFLNNEMFLFSYTKIMISCISNIQKLLNALLHVYNIIYAYTLKDTYVLLFFSIFTQLINGNNCLNFVIRLHIYIF